MCEMHAGAASRWHGYFEDVGDLRHQLADWDAQALQELLPQQLRSAGKQAGAAAAHTRNDTCVCARVQDKEAILEQLSLVGLTAALHSATDYRRREFEVCCVCTPPAVSEILHGTECVGAAAAAAPGAVSSRNIQCRGICTSMGCGCSGPGCAC